MDCVIRVNLPQQSYDIAVVTGGLDDLGVWMSV